MPTKEALDRWTALAADWDDEYTDEMISTVRHTIEVDQEMAEYDAEDAEIAANKA